MAQARVASEAGMPTGEGDKFVLLLHGPRESAPFLAPIEAGSWVDISVRPHFHVLNARHDAFFGRRDDMYGTIALIMNRNPLVTIRGAGEIARVLASAHAAPRAGPPGIGKTSLAIAIANFVLERHMFRDGVVFVAWSAAASRESMIGAVLRACTDCAGVPRAADGESAAGDQLESAVFAVLKSAHALIVLDNAEIPLQAIPGECREWIGRLFHRCPHVECLLTSRQSVGRGFDCVAEKVVNLRALQPVDAARMFVRRAPRALSRAEVFADGTRCSGTAALEVLSKHPVLRFLDGNPLAIALSVPLLTDRTLPELSALLLRRGSGGGELRVWGMHGEDSGAVNTLVASLQMSVDHLRRRQVCALPPPLLLLRTRGISTSFCACICVCVQPLALCMFALFGLLPGGASDVDLDCIWRSGPEPAASWASRALAGASDGRRRTVSGVSGVSPNPDVRDDDGASVRTHDSAMSVVSWLTGAWGTVGAAGWGAAAPHLAGAADGVESEWSSLCDVLARQSLLDKNGGCAHEKSQTRFAAHVCARHGVVDRAIGMVWTWWSMLPFVADFAESLFCSVKWLPRDVTVASIFSSHGSPATPPADKSLAAVPKPGSEVVPPPPAPPTVPDAPDGSVDSALVAFDVPTHRMLRVPDPATPAAEAGSPPVVSALAPLALSALRRPSPRSPGAKSATSPTALAVPAPWIPVTVSDARAPTSGARAGAAGGGVGQARPTMTLAKLHRNTAQPGALRGVVPAESASSAAAPSSRLRPPPLHMEDVMPPPSKRKGAVAIPVVSDEGEATDGSVGGGGSRGGGGGGGGGGGTSAKHPADVKTTKSYQLRLQHAQKLRDGEKGGTAGGVGPVSPRPHSQSVSFAAPPPQASSGPGSLGTGQPTSVGRTKRTRIPRHSLLPPQPIARMQASPAQQFLGALLAVLCLWAVPVIDLLAGPHVAFPAAALAAVLHPHYIIRVELMIRCMLHFTHV